MSGTLRIAVTVSAFIATTLFAGYSSAAEQMRSPVVAIIDFQQITRDSKAGATVREKIATQHAIYQNEIQRLQGDLEIERKSIQEKQKKLSREKFEELSKTYRGKAENLQKLVDGRKQFLDQMYANGMRTIEAELLDIVKNIASENGIDMILNATSGQGIVIYANPEIVITGEAQLRLNQRLPEVNLAPPPMKGTGTGEDKAKKTGAAKE